MSEAWATGRTDGKEADRMRNPRKLVGKIADKAAWIGIADREEEGEDLDEPVNIRASATLQGREGIRIFYLDVPPAKTADFRREPRASLYMTAHNCLEGVCLSGKLEVTAEEPDRCALKFTAERGRYYSNVKSVNFEIPD